MRIAEKFALRKSADISQNVRLDGLFENLKISYMGFFLYFRGPSFTLWFLLELKNNFQRI